jgi:hypothetical protein
MRRHAAAFAALVVSLPSAVWRSGRTAFVIRSTMLIPGDKDNSTSDNVRVTCSPTYVHGE